MTEAKESSWEREVAAGHRWGRFPDRVAGELARLRKVWNAAQPLEVSVRPLIRQICALEICNWRLEDSILVLCRAIGEKRPADTGIGHLASMSQDRWEKVWAYYLALREWLASERKSAYDTLLRTCDPSGTVQSRVSELLGERDELKELYVERLCRCLEFWLAGFLADDSAQARAHAAAVSVIERELEARDPGSAMAEAMKPDDKLPPCHHKAFRRYDILLASIGAGQWRAGMPIRGTDGFQRAGELKEHLGTVEKWIGGGRGSEAVDDSDLSREIRALLGQRDATKVFLVSLLTSLLRAQQLAAVRRAERRTEGQRT